MKSKLRKHHIFHLTFNGRRSKKRTTLSMDNLLSELLAIKLECKDPHSRETHTKVREWLEKEVTSSLGKTAKKSVSYWAKRKVIEAIACPDLMKRHTDWLIG